MAQTVVIVYAPAGNEVNIPVTAFRTLKEAEKKISSIMGKPKKRGNRMLEWRFPEVRKLRRIRSSKTKSGRRKRKTAWDINKEMLKQKEEMVLKLFNGYYSGCGDCYSIVAREIQSGQLQLFSFDLD